MVQIKIVVVEDHKIVRLGIDALLSTKPDLHLCGEAATVAEGLSLIDAHQPDIAIVDINLLDDNGLALAKKVKEKYGEDIKIIIFPGFDCLEFVKAAFSNGADSYCTKMSDEKKLLEAIYTTYRGECWLDSSIQKLLVEDIRNGGRQPELYDFFMAEDSN